MIADILKLVLSHVYYKPLIHLFELFLKIEIKPFLPVALKIKSEHYQDSTDRILHQGEENIASA